MTLPLVTSQRGVGWTQVVKPPLVIGTASALSFSMLLAVEVDVRILVAELPRSAVAPQRHDARRLMEGAGACRQSYSTRSAAMRPSALVKTTLPWATSGSCR